MTKTNTKKSQTERDLAAKDYFSIISPYFQIIMNRKKHAKKENKSLKEIRKINEHS